MSSWLGIMGVALGQAGPPPDLMAEFVQLWSEPLAVFVEPDGAAAVASPQWIHRIDRSGITSTPTDEGVYLDGAVPYPRGGVGTPNDMLLIYDPDTRSIIDALAPAAEPLYTVPEGASDSPRFAAGDVDGDGTMDLLTWHGLLLMRASGPVAVPGPWGIGNRDIDAYSFAYPVSDLDGDGHADLVAGNLTDVFGFISFPDTAAAEAVVLRGGPNGYDEVPVASFALDGAAGWPVAMQADLDPELELVMVVGQTFWYASGGEDTRIVTIDDPMGAAIVHDPVARLDAAQGPNRYQLPVPRPVRDVDGDGLDDLLLPSADLVSLSQEFGLHPTADHLLVGSSRGYDVTQPLRLFQMPSHAEAWNLRDSGAVVGAIVDLDGDGHDDLVATQSEERPCVAVWFGPLYEPVTDTGPAPETVAPTQPTDPPDTGVNDTGATDGDPRADSIGGAPRSNGDPPPCGCQAAGHPRWPLVRRRAPMATPRGRGRSSAASP